MYFYLLVKQRLKNAYFLFSFKTVARKPIKTYRNVLLKANNNSRKYCTYIVGYCQELINQCVPLLCGWFLSSSVASDVSYSILCKYLLYRYIFLFIESINSSYIIIKKKKKKKERKIIENKTNKISNKINKRTDSFITYAYTCINIYDT